MSISLKSSVGGVLGALLVISTALTGCATKPEPVVIQQTVQNFKSGTVIGMREIPLKNDDAVTGVMTGGGAVIGGVLGSNIGSGNGKTAATIGGAVLGGIAGNQMDKVANRRSLTELTIRFDNNEVNVFTIDPEEIFRVGDRVKQFETNGYMRITH